MGTRSIKAIIKNARRKAGLTQEEMSEGVCSVQALSRIETGICNASPSTFSALLAKTNTKCEVFPAFLNIDDFSCYYSLQLARFHIKSQKYALAYEELNKVAVVNWCANKFYYQEWLYLEYLINVSSSHYNHLVAYNKLTTAIHISRPSFDITKFNELFLTKLEIEIIICLSRELFYLNEIESFLKVHSSVIQYLSSVSFSSEDYDFLYVCAEMPYVYYLLSSSLYSEAFTLCETLKKKAFFSFNTHYLLEITLCMGVCSYYLNEKKEAFLLLNSCLYTANSIESPFYNFCIMFLKKNGINSDSICSSDLKDIPESFFSFPTLTPVGDLNDGVYSNKSYSFLTIGALIFTLRTNQSLSQEKLAYGLCSKSALSKIENDVLQPSITLVEALLQRLGISERIFSFCGNDEDYIFNNLKYSFYYSTKRSTEELNSSLYNLESVSEFKDKSKYQFYLFVKALQNEDATKKLNELKEALRLTFPKMDFANLRYYRLSWCELSIINNIAEATFEICPNEGINLFYNILDYMNNNDLDILLKTAIFPITISNFCRCLYLEDRFAEQLALEYRFDFSFLQYKLGSYSQYLFFLSQINGKVNKIDEARKMAKYSVNISTLLGNHRNAKILTEAMAQDYSIIL